MAEVAGRRHRGHAPLVIDSTEPEVIQTGLELLVSRAVVNSVNYEDGG
jgi:5-methyltetrahydrofolate--homocysteine methyltransferase